MYCESAAEVPREGRRGTAEKTYYFRDGYYNFTVTIISVNARHVVVAIYLGRWMSSHFRHTIDRNGLLEHSLS